MKQPIKISKDLRAGFMKEPLTEGELKALKKIGVIAANWYAVTYDENQMPFAIFDSEPHAIGMCESISSRAFFKRWFIAANGSGLVAVGDLMHYCSINHKS